MPRDDRDDPFDDIFREIERMMEEMTGGTVDIDASVGGAGGGDAHFSIHEADGEVCVVGDLPGVDREAIDVKCDGRGLTVAARDDAGSYERRVDLPAQVDEHSAQATFNNGVLEVRLQRDGGDDVGVR